MAQEETGVLPRQVLFKMMQAGNVTDVAKRYVNPASIDLPLSDEVYRLERIFLPRRGEKVRSLIKMVGGTPHDLKSPLEVGVPYLIRISGTYRLPPNVYGYANPKSSTGRINLFARIVADGVQMYDALTPPGWRGELWVLVRAESFPVLLAAGQAVSQIRFFDGKNFLDPLDLNLAIERDGLLYHPDGKKFEHEEIQRHADSVLLTIRIGKGHVGWVCRGTRRVLDYGKIDYYRPEDFFEPLYSKGDSIELKVGDFCILTTEECIMVPPDFSAELRAIDPRFGEFRSHGAGFIDAGWGWGTDGSSRGRPITLEVTPHEEMEFRHGQVVARIRYERMKQRPSVVYDAAKSNYTMQRTAALSKHFQQP